nr:hypothetical protein [Tanacetum cinerariifolium]
VLLKLILSVHRYSIHTVKRSSRNRSGVKIQDLSCSIIKDKYMMKAQHMLRGRLLESFQNLEHEGGDTRLQGGIKDNDFKIKIQDLRRANNDSNKFPRTRLKVSRKVHLNDHPLGGDC